MRTLRQGHAKMLASACDGEVGDQDGSGDDDDNGEVEDCATTAAMVVLVPLCACGAIHTETLETVAEQRFTSLSSTPREVEFPPEKLSR